MTARHEGGCHNRLGHRAWTMAAIRHAELRAPDSGKSVTPAEKRRSIGQAGDTVMLGRAYHLGNFSP
jgi:hypothetical protein